MYLLSTVQRELVARLGKQSNESVFGWCRLYYLYVLFVLTGTNNNNNVDSWIANLFLLKLQTMPARSHYTTVLNQVLLYGNFKVTKGAYS